MEPGEEIAAYVCVGVGGFLLIVMIIIICVLVYTGKCSFCCGPPTPRKEDKTQLKYKVEHELQNSRPTGQYKTARSGVGIYNKRYVATAANSTYSTRRAHDDGTMSTNTSNRSSPRHQRRQHKHHRVKRIKRSNSFSGLDSSYSSADYPDLKQKPFTLRVEDPGFTMHQPQPYTYIDSQGNRFNVNSTNKQQPVGRSACIYSNATSNADSRTVSRTSSTKFGDSSKSITQNGFARAPNLRVNNGGIEFVNTVTHQTDTVDGPIVLRWSPSMRRQTKQGRKGSSQSAPASALSSRAGTVDTPLSTRRTIHDVRF